jgi:hypothetical protein
MTLANADQLGQVLGPDWQQMGMSRLFDLSHEHEKAAKLAAALARYLAETGGGTAGDALARLEASSTRNAAA